jgi:hypothetical protein
MPGGARTGRNAGAVVLVVLVWWCWSGGGARVCVVQDRVARIGVRHAWQPCRSTSRGPPGTHRSDRRVLPGDARRTVGTERVGHGPGVVEPALRLTHGP